MEKNWNRFNMKHKSFTLIELLIVIAIIAILESAETGMPVEVEY